MNLHHSYGDSSAPPSSDLPLFGGVNTGGRKCGVINTDVLQQVVAAKWALEVINNQSEEEEILEQQRRSGRRRGKRRRNNQQPVRNRIGKKKGCQNTSFLVSVFSICDLFCVGTIVVSVVFNVYYLICRCTHF